MITTNSADGNERVDVTGMEMLPVTILADYRKNGATGVIDVGTFSIKQTKELTKIGLQNVLEYSDGWSNPDLMIKKNKSACTSCIKKLDDGSLLMGRNMDIPIKYDPVFIFRTKGNGKTTYDTVNIGSCTSGEIHFDQIAELQAIPKDMFATMAVETSDTINSAGLFIEVNMRHCDGFACSSTNPKSKFRTACITLCRLIGDHCATIAEAIDYVSTLDIYDPKCLIFDWQVGICMMDQTGRYGVLEFTNNKIFWNEGHPGFACGQANFYWNKEGAKSKYGQGYGRWQALMENYNYINSMDDMDILMQKIWFSNLFTDGSLCKDWKIDWLSEVTDKTPNCVNAEYLRLINAWIKRHNIEVDKKELARVKTIGNQQEKKNIVWDIDYLNNPESYYNVISVIDLFTKCFAQIPIGAKKKSGMMEATFISYVCNTKKLEYKTHFFEMDDIFYIGLYETKIERKNNHKILDCRKKRQK